MGVLSGLEKIIFWALSKTKPEKKDSAYVKALRDSLREVTYTITGALPAEIQEIEGKKTEIDPLKFTKYSIEFTVLTGCVKYLIALKAEGMPFLEHFANYFEYWAIVGNGISITARGIYMMAQKKPIGSLIVEGAYCLIPHRIIKKYGERNETTTLQQKLN